MSDMELYVMLTPAAQPIGRHAGRGGITPKEFYLFKTPVRALERVRWGPNMLCDWLVRCAARVPEGYRRYLPRGGPLWIDDDHYWLTADFSARTRNESAEAYEHNLLALRPFIASGAIELSLEEAT